MPQGFALRPPEKVVPESAMLLIHTEAIDDARLPTDIPAWPKWLASLQKGLILIGLLVLQRVDVSL